MTNNDVFKKLRVALMLRDDDIIEILKLVDFKVSKSELGAFFRKEDHPNYVECGDQILRNFLNGLVVSPYVEPKKIPKSRVMFFQKRAHRPKKQFLTPTNLVLNSYSEKKRTPLCHP